MGSVVRTRSTGQDVVSGMDTQRLVIFSWQYQLNLSGPKRTPMSMFLELSEDDPELEKERAIAIQLVERHFPYLLD